VATPRVAIAHDDAATPALILDAGTGLRRATPLLRGGPFTGTIMLTHLHWDHVHGLPFFAAGDRDDARVTLLLPGNGSAGAEELLARGMSAPHFPIAPKAAATDRFSARISSIRSVAAARLAATLSAVWAGWWRSWLVPLAGLAITAGVLLSAGISASPAPAAAPAVISSGGT
jgi:hypothetical protein